MTIRTGFMKAVGALLLLAGIVDALAMNWNRASASTCQFIQQTNAQLGDSGAPPPGCGPVNYTLAIVLICVGVGLIVLALFIKEEPRDAAPLDRKRGTR